jgi:hypothetical protein
VISAATLVILKLDEVDGVTGVFPRLPLRDFEECRSSTAIPPTAPASSSSRAASG